MFRPENQEWQQGVETVLSHRMLANDVVSSSGGAWNHLAHSRRYSTQLDHTSAIARVSIKPETAPKL